MLGVPVAMVELTGPEPLSVTTVIVLAFKFFLV
jgi:hypothetical protein